MDIKIMMVCGLHRLPNGNTVLTNVKHGTPYGQGKEPKLFEITRSKRLVWMWSDEAEYNIGNIQISGIEGDPRRGEVFK